MSFKTKQEFLFKCNKCSLIVSVEYDEEEDLDRARNDEIVLICPCEGECKILRN